LLPRHCSCPPPFCPPQNYTSTRPGESPSALTDKGLANLKGLAELRELRVESEDVTDEGVGHIAGLSKLEKLTLFRCTRVADAGVAKLKGLTRLKELGLQGTGLTDAGMATLRELPALESVDISGTRVTKAGAKAFQSARPKVRTTHLEGW
jgi:hypothetical protein